MLEINLYFLHDDCITIYFERDSKDCSQHFNSTCFYNNNKTKC